MRRENSAEEIRAALKLPEILTKMVRCPTCGSSFEAQFKLGRQMQRFCDECKSHEV
jgi:hypothetical protein